MTYLYRSAHLRRLRLVDDPTAFAALTAAVALEHPIPMKDLVARDLYEVYARNIDLTVWTGEEFLGIREKFGNRYLFGEFPAELKHGFATATPYVRIGRLPDAIRLPGQAVEGQPIEVDLFHYLDQLGKGEVAPTG